MTRQHSTKRALIASILVLCLCFTSLIGTTFAWFTDSVTSSGNIIQSGSLKVEMHWAEGDEDPNSAKWTNAESGAIFKNDLWEPGYAEAKHVKIANVGTLALKYQLRIVANSEFSKLADVIDVYYYADATQLDREDLDTATKLGTLTEVLDPGFEDAIHKVVSGSLEAGKVETLTLVLKMRESAGNEYQNLALSDAGFSIQLIATQYSFEDDSFGKDYDSEALYPPVTTPGYTLPGNNDYTAFTFMGADMIVKGNATLAAKLAADGVEKLVFEATIPVVKDGVVTVEDASFYDEDGNKIDLSANTEPISVKLYVGTENAGKSTIVYHDGKLVAAVTVDAEGYVAYNTTHFCKITVELDKEIPEGSVIIDGEVVEDEKVDELPLTTKVEMLVGAHIYTVSLGMQKSWYEYENVAGKIEADVYIPEDLHAFSMMYKNGDLAETGSHSDLTIKEDLDFADMLYEPIGRFYTNIHGENHTISNLNDSLFGCVYDCQLFDVTLENVNVTGSAAGIIAKELAGDAQVKNVTIAGKNSVTYAEDGETNWPESGYGIGAIAGVSLVGCSAPAIVEVAITGTVELNYGENAIFYNKTNLENLGITKELGLNVYKPNAGVTVTGSENITVTGNCYMLIADGVGVSADGKTYIILNANGLEWFAEEVNAADKPEYEGNTFDGKTVLLMNDIDLDGAEWMPIGNFGLSSKQFSGIFDGQGHTVSNFKITQKMADREGKNRSSHGFFGNVNGTVKNLIIDNANVTVTNDGRFMGILVGRLNGNGGIENCVVKNSYLKASVWQAGAIVGQLNGNSAVTGCVVENTTVIAGGGTGIIAGLQQGATNVVIENCTVKNCALVDSEIYGAPYNQMFAVVLGANYNANAKTTINNCTIVNTTLNNILTDSVCNYAEGTLIVDGEYYIAGAAALKAALSSGVKTINIISDITLTESLAATDVTFIGKGDAAGINFDGYNIGGSNTVTYQSLNLRTKSLPYDNGKNGERYGWYGGIDYLGHTVSNYIDCNISGVFTLYCDTVNVTDCTFDYYYQDDEFYNLFVYGADTVNVSGCTFDYGDRAIKIYTEGAGHQPTVTIEDCHVAVDEGYKINKAIIEIDAYADEVKLNYSNITVDEELKDVPLYKVSNSKPVYINGNQYIAYGLTKDVNLPNTYYVSNANGLSVLNGKMIDGSAGKSARVVLTDDIDFTGKTWTPVDAHYEFKFSLLEFDGNGHTISNLTVNGQAMFTRFVNYEETVTIKNLTFDGANVNSNGSINTAIIVAHTYNELLLDNVDVKNSTITGGYKVATLIGTVYNENAAKSFTATIKNCDIDNCSVTSTVYDFMTCGAVAFLYEGDGEKLVFENSTISNTTLYNTKSSGYNYHAFLYYTDAPVDDCFNEADGITVTNCQFVSLEN